MLTEHLKQSGFCTIGTLSSLLGVSTRTVTRDIQILREQGLPIAADRGRGGGVQLDQHWGVGRMKLSYPEAVDLLVSLAVAEQMNSPLFLAQLGSIRAQLIASFAPDKRQKVTDLKARILVGGSASPFVLSSFETAKQSIVQHLHQAFVSQQCLVISYLAEGGAKTERKIEPHYLLLTYPVWYVLAWDRLRDDARTFRCDRILDAHVALDKFKLLPKDTFRSSIEGSVLI